jgi:hypothetical protein
MPPAGIGFAVGVVQKAHEPAAHLIAAAASVQNQKEKR